MKNNWTRSGNLLVLTEVSQQQKSLEPGVYRIDLNDFTKELYLTHTDDAFQLPEKLYGSDRVFAQPCVHTYEATKGNFGTLLSGVKGTGKTVTAKLISNMLKLPVLLVHDLQDGLPKFINSIQQDIIVFIDEYEKIYNNYDYSVLTLMDGVLSTVYRRVFLLTTNNPWVNHNMLQRPSRIRYVKTFGDLDIDTITEIVDDMLLHKELREETIKYLSTLETITIDITKAIIEEVNIHHESPVVFGSFFNTKQVDNKVCIYNITNEGDRVVETVKFTTATIKPAKITNQDIGKTFEINDRYEGVIKQVLGDVVTYEDLGDELVSIRIERLNHTHSSFAF